jgi:hypothetical protein
MNLYFLDLCYSTLISRREYNILPNGNSQGLIHDTIFRNGKEKYKLSWCTSRMKNFSIWYHNMMITFFQLSPEIVQVELRTIEKNFVQMFMYKMWLEATTETIRMNFEKNNAILRLLMKLRYQGQI